MERLIAWWANNHIAASLLMVGILLAGLIGFNNMEREAFPIFRTNQVSVEVVWPGAAPQEVEEQVVARIEQALTNLATVRLIYGTAEEGAGRLEIYTYPSVSIEAFLDEVRGAVDAVTGLPRDIEPPQVKRVQFRQEMIRVAVHGDLSERQLTRLAESLRDEMQSLDYISVVDLFGTRREEVSIELSETAMRRYGLTFEEVARAIRGSSVNLSGGSIRTQTGDVRLRARNMADDETDFASIVIRQSADGGILRVGDVAHVVDGFEDEEILATLNGEPAVLLQAMSNDDMQVVKSSDAVKAWIAEREPTLPEGVSLSIWFDTADIYKNRMSTIGTNAWQGLVLVFLVLILSLRPKVALWVTAGIGVAFMGTFAILPANDVSLNILSTFAFLLVLGIVVDDAIVVGESIHQHAHAAGGGTTATAIAGAQAVAKPVIFAVLTTMVAFAPWFFLSGEDVQITRQFSIVITAALVISLVEAFLILPSHLRHLPSRPREGQGDAGATGFGRRLARWQRHISDGITGFADTHYRRVVDACLKHRYLTASAFLAAFVISVGVLSSGWVRFGFMPEVENEQIYVQVQLPAGTPYSRALEILGQLQDAEKQLIDEVEAEAATSDGSGKLVEGWYTRSRRDSVIAIVKLAPPEVRDLSSKEAALRLRDLIGDVPDADEIEVQYTMNDSSPQVSFMLRGDDMDVLRAAAGDLKRKLDAYDGTFYVRDNLRGENDELHMQLRPGAEQLGLTLAQVSEQVRQAYFGEEVQRLPRSTGDVKVMVRYPKELRSSLDSLDRFNVRTPDGREVPLMAVADVSVASGTQRIQRRDGERMIAVTADVLDSVRSDIRTDIEENFIPELQKAYPDLTFGRFSDDEEIFFAEIKALYTIALFVMYALIAVAFRSYWLPLLVMTAIPFGFMGAVYGHLMFDTAMALFSFFGIGAAAGVVVNDNLVLVDYIQRQRDKGMTVFEAVIESGVTRFRPILLTTVTTFVGLMPLMAERSTDAQFLKPAVLSLSFGVLFALAVTLLLVPALYCIGEDATLAIARLKARFGSKSAEARVAAG
ncbi:MAG TPA: efflux RND transporter permease subunit [Pseudomonadales bacterium]|nr:efflux RND transporter permease subunit [Pseudomonadales bacterium]